jgi:GNAT superfamily N-acetyltransferase
MKVRFASEKDSDSVGTLVFELMKELSAPKPLMVSCEEVIQTARKLLGGSTVWALLAETDEGKPAGVLTLNACAAVYAGGYFGEITELFVRPALRRQRVGKQLLDAAIEFGKKQDWTRLEVCAPPVPPWDRSVSFYQQNGFLLLGPRLKFPFVR